LTGRKKPVQTLPAILAKGMFYYWSTQVVLAESDGDTTPKPAQVFDAFPFVPSIVICCVTSGTPATCVVQVHVCDFVQEATSKPIRLSIKIIFFIFKIFLIQLLLSELIKQT